MTTKNNNIEGKWFSIMNGYEFKTQFIEKYIGLYKNEYNNEYDNTTLFISIICENNIVKVLAFNIFNNDDINNPDFLNCIYGKYINIGNENNRNLIFNELIPYFNPICDDNYNFQFIKMKIDEYNDTLQYILK